MFERTEVITAFQEEYRFLSNFWFATVEFDGEYYRTTEHAYQAAKTLDTELRKEIADLETAGQSKRAGSLIPLRADWDEVKTLVMWHIINQKFRIASLSEKLLATGDAQIIEGNEWHDIYWGCCVCPKHRGEGENNLGRMLMQIREDLQNGVNEWQMWDTTKYFNTVLTLKEPELSLFEILDED